MTITTMKKYFEAPYIQVVQVKNDIIATSGSLDVDPNNPNEIDRIQGRRGMWDDGFSEEDLY